ncbi:MAG: hypothetical protein U1D30_24925 [Planctomycetota bacterium]
MNLRSFRLMFFVGALWNFLVAIVAIIFASWVTRFFYGQPVEGVVGMLAWKDFAACVFLFGVGYLLVAINPWKNHGIVFLGILGKLAVTWTFLSRYWHGIATIGVIFPVAVDFTFALLFAWFLLRRRRVLGPAW